MKFDPHTDEREARRMRSEAMAKWLGTLPQRLFNKAHDLVAFIRQFRMIRGARV
jgi:hypothetical protein